MEIKTISGELDRLFKILDDAKKQEANLTGRLTEAMRRLKEEHGFSSLEEAKEMKLQLEEEIASIETDINTEFAKLQEKYEW